MDEKNYCICGSPSYFAEHFGYEKDNTIWKMPSVLLTESLAVELQGQEPWPEDVKLFQPYEIEQILLPDNANCLAVQAYLKMNGLQFNVVHRHNAEDMSPSKKVPFIKCGAFIVSELESIVGFVHSKGISLSDQLEDTQKADMRAYMSLVNNVLYTAELYISWCDSQTYDRVTYPRYSSVFPWPLNYLVTTLKKRNVIKKLHVLEWSPSKKSLQQVLDDVNICCQSLSERLDKGPYFFGNKPTELDALVFGHVFAILTTALPGNKLAEVLKNYKVLINHCSKIENVYFTRDTA